MKKLFFLLLFPLWGIGGFPAFAQSHINIELLSATYTAPAVQFRVSWNSIPAVDGETHNSKIWLWVDFRKIENNQPSGAWTRATVANPSSGTVAPETDKGFWLQGNSGSYSQTVTVALTNIPANTKFNWCAYASDCPPNVTVTSTGYQLKGSPPFSITYNNGSSTVTSNKTFNLGCINTITDATGCPGRVDEPSAPTNGIDGSRCNAGTVTVSASPPANCTIDWYTTASGNTMVANGTGVTTLTTPAIQTTTYYYAASRHLITGCVSSTRTSVTAAVTNGSGRDETPNTCGCASGLTLIGSYCRDLVADEASTYTGCGIEIKANNQGKLTSFGGEDYLCPSGWRYPVDAEAACMSCNFTEVGIVDEGDWKHEIICKGSDNTSPNYVTYHSGNCPTGCGKGNSWSRFISASGWVYVRCVRN